MPELIAHVVRAKDGDKINLPDNAKKLQINPIAKKPDEVQLIWYEIISGDEE